MNQLEELTIAEIVAKDFRTSDVFRNHGIDFCCGGKIQLSIAAEQHQIEVSKLVDEIQSIQNQENGQVHDYDQWQLDFLADYIEQVHHRYVTKEVPVLRSYLAKIAEVHGHNHPELKSVEKLFDTSASALLTHMQNEEKILFPLIRKLVARKNKDGNVAKTAYIPLHNPIVVMVQEHETEGNRFKEIARLTQNYNVPADACNTYMVALSKLEAFERDLHLHIHLENNILFPKASELEKLLLQ